MLHHRPLKRRLSSTQKHPEPKDTVPAAQPMPSSAPKMSDNLIKHVPSTHIAGNKSGIFLNRPEQLNASPQLRNVTQEYPSHGKLSVSVVCCEKTSGMSTGSIVFSVKHP